MKKLKKKQLEINQKQSKNYKKLKKANPHLKDYKR